MNKDEVVEIMCKVVEDINRKMAEDMPIGSDELEQALAKNRSQLVSISGALYDKLFDYGIIQR
jgi:DNA-directed RNA polymerase subunit F